MRPIWKGSISFGLVNIPMTLYPATHREELKFRLLRASDLSPVNYQRVAEADGKEVPWDQIVKGYEYEEGKFVVLKEDDFKRVDVEATQTVDILDFVELKEISPMYFHKPFYMEPAKGGAKAYVLLRDQGLVLELMHFSNELIDSDVLHLPDNVAVGKKEMEMAKTLIDQMTQPWRPDKYQDDYRSALLKLIEQRIQSGGKSPKAARRRTTPATNVVDLMEVLRKSLGARTRSKSRPKRKRKPAARSVSRRANAA
jgi:DNA end-binding protein Ku